MYMLKCNKNRLVVASYLLCSLACNAKLNTHKLGTRLQAVMFGCVRCGEHTMKTRTEFNKKL